jgi:hypothetical protein
MSGWDPKPQLQRVIDAGEMLLARSDHPVTQSAAADGNAGTLEGLGQAIERCAVDIFVNEREGQRRSRGDAARQGLRGHRREDDRRVDAGSVAMTARILEPHILKDLGLHLDMELLGDGLAHAMHLMLRSRDRPSDRRQGHIRHARAAGFPARSCGRASFPGLCTRRQASVRQVGDIAVVVIQSSSSSATCSASLKRRSTCFSLLGAKRCNRASASSSSSLTTRCEQALLSQP